MKRPSWPWTWSCEPSWVREVDATSSFHRVFSTTAPVRCVGFGEKVKGQRRFLCVVSAGRGPRARRRGRPRTGAVGEGRFRAPAEPGAVWSPTFDRSSLTDSGLLITFHRFHRTGCGLPGRVPPVPPNRKRSTRSRSSAPAEPAAVCPVAFHRFHRTGCGPPGYVPLLLPPRQRWLQRASAENSATGPGCNERIESLPRTGTGRGRAHRRPADVRGRCR